MDTNTQSATANRILVLASGAGGKLLRKDALAGGGRGGRVAAAVRGVDVALGPARTTAGTKRASEHRSNRGQKLRRRPADRGKSAGEAIVAAKSGGLVGGVVTIHG